MSTPEESLNDQDPDYVSAISNDQVQRKIYEENARTTTARKITAIVEKEFSREIDLKEKEILQIQERLHKALKIFHFLRYVIITNFYNRKQCQVPQTSETTTKQTRIHPAIKSLLGKCPKSVHCTDLAVPSTSTDPRFLYNDESFVSDARIAVLSEDNATDKCDGVLRGEKRNIPDKESRPRKIPRYVPPKSSTPEKMCPSRGNSHKVRKRVIVGNISKWIPPDWREDSSSHKWTMYVRGDKENENANISTFVSKVRFFLHPSYRPNDVVEVASYPFHLSRRGWGEFPLRVQLHFKNALNKPMDIIHHLKLDRTYTGLQTLGSETVVDVWIHMAEYRNFEQSSSSSSNSSSSSSNEFAIEPSADKTSVKIESNDGDSFEFIYKQFAESAETSRLIARTLEDIGPVKKEISNSNVCRIQSEPLLDSVLTEKSEKDEVKIKSNGTNGIDLEEKRRCIKLDHNYYLNDEQHCNSYHSIVREGNVTIKHFSKDEYVPATNSPAAVGDDNGEERSDSVTTTSRRFNGDVQSSGNCQPLINGFCSSHFSSISSSLKPLEISIPPANNIFASTTNKHVFVLKDKKSVSMNLTDILPSKSNENSKRIVDGNVRVSIARDVNVAKLNVRIPQGVSILKKPPNAKVNARQKDTANNNNNNNDKKANVLMLKGTNSLLLNVNENVPILKIADSRDPRYNYNLAETTRNVVSATTDKREIVSCARSEDRAVVQRAKITLGKDKYKIQSKRELYEAVLRSIDIANIVDTEALIRFVIRRLPIVTRDAYDPEYKQLHPYACCNEEEYLAHNVGKQRALEWYRAKTIKYFLQTKPIPLDRLWSIKEIILWARLHGYTPSRSIFGVSETVTTSDAKIQRLSDVTIATSVPRSTYTEPIALQKWLQQTYQQESNHQPTDGCIEDEEIDVENIGDNIECKTRVNRKKNGDNRNSDCSIDSTLISLELDENLLPFHNFVCNTARDIGIKIGPEEIVPGVLYCAASRVIMRVIECFAEDLTRSSLARAWERNSGNECPKVITLNDVRNALANREEFDIFTNEGLGSRQQLSTTELSSL